MLLQLIKVPLLPNLEYAQWKGFDQAISKFYVKPNFTFWVPLQTSSSSSSPCDKGCHLMTVTSLVKQLKVKPKLFMFQNQVKFPLTNDTRQN